MVNNIPALPRRAPHPPTRLTRFAIALALSSIMLGRLVVDVGPVALSIERTLGLAMIAPMAISLIMSNYIDERQQITWIWLFWCVASLISALFSGSFVAHLAPLILTVVPVAFLWLVSRSVIDPAFVDLWARRILWVNGTIGLLALLGSSIPVIRDLELQDGANRLYLLAREPNLLGSGTAFLLCLTLARARFKARTVILYLLSLTLLLGSLSKMPLIALAAGLPLYLLLRSIAKRTGGAVAIILPIWAALIAVMGLFTFLPQAQTLYTTALERADAVYSRGYTLRLALARYEESPIIGRGPGDFGLQNVIVLKKLGTDDEGNLWIWQMFVNILHDSGLVGLIIYSTFLLLLIHRGMVAIKRGSLDHAAYLTGFIVVLLSSQASSVHLNAIFGIAAGLVIARTARAPQSRPRAQPRGAAASL